MGKYKRYKNKLEMALSSEKGKRRLNRAYSIGASMVVIGAMFKIVRLPGADIILCASLIVEAIVFFISAFERPSTEYNWEEVFPVLESKNPLDRPDFAAGGSGIIGGGVVNIGGGMINVGGSGEGEGFTGSTGTAGGGFTGNVGMAGGGGGFTGGMGGGFMGGGGFAGSAGVAGDDSGNAANDSMVNGDVAGTGGGVVSDGTGGMAGGGPVFVGGYAGHRTPQNVVNAGMATMGLDLSEQDSEMLAESIKKLNSAAEQISKMADLTEATQTYIDQISTVSQSLEKFAEITGTLGEVSDSLINSCKIISGSSEEGAEETPKSYVEHMSQLNDNISGLNEFYETQFTGLRTQMETIHHINAGLNRIRDMYDSSLVDSSAFRNENERMAQLLGQLNQVYGRLLQAMTVNIPGGGYAPPAQPGYQQPPYPGGGYR